MRPPGVPNTVSFEKLQAALRKKQGHTTIGSMWDLYGGGKTVPGDGCPCEDCAKERKALIDELAKRVHEDHKLMIQRSCPQRAAHDLNKEEVVPVVRRQLAPGSQLSASAIESLTKMYEQQMREGFGFYMGWDPGKKDDDAK